MTVATMRMPALPANQLATAGVLLQVSSAIRSSLHRRVTGRRNRLLAYGLWEAHGGLCGRCELEIDPTLHHSLPGALTIGHIVPISLGGSNDPRNLRPEHSRCNKAAGNRPTRPVARIVRP